MWKKKTQQRPRRERNNQRKRQNNQRREHVFSPADLDSPVRSNNKRVWRSSKPSGRNVIMRQIKRQKEQSLT